MSNILEQILATKGQEIQHRQAQVPLAELKQRVLQAPKPKDLLVPYSNAPHNSKLGSLQKLKKPLQVRA